MKINVKTLLSDPAHFIAMGFGAGLSPKMPGTIGTALAVVIYLLLPDLNAIKYLSLVLIITVVGTWAAHRSARLLQADDPGFIVIDEIAGMLLALFMLPDGWIWVAISFLLFRLFDVVKPLPICLVDRYVHGGIGIMLDDILAGIYTLISLQVLIMILGFVTHT